MPRHALKTLLVLAAIAGAAVAPPFRDASAQVQVPTEETTRAAGWYLLPSVSITEIFDDNIFQSTRSREADAITRFSPELGFGYRSIPLTVLGYVLLDAELFAVHTDQSGLNRKQVRFDAESRPDQTLTLRLSGVFDQTETPTDLTQNLGLQLGRTESTRGSISAGAAYRFDRRFTGEASYTFTTDTSGGISNTLHQALVSLVGQLTPRDAGRIVYHMQRGNSDGEAVASDSLVFGWDHRLSETTSFSVALGPRYSDGQLQVEAYASVIHRLTNGQLSATFARTEGTIIGQRGLSTTTSFGAGISLRPWRALGLSITPHFAEVTGGLHTTTYGSEFTARYEIARYIQLVTQYAIAYQKGGGGANGSGGNNGSGDILHNTVSIGLRVALPERLH
jgi:hypothetical protein